jgi:hypothetical protein
MESGADLCFGAGKMAAECCTEAHTGLEALPISAVLSVICREQDSQD